MLANRPEFAMVFYGVLHAGAVVVPIDPLRGAREVEFFLTNTGARLLVFAPSCGAAATAGALAAGVPRIGVGENTLEDLTGSFLGQPWPVTRAGDDNAVILHTSNTTGVPKGAQLTHSNLACNQGVIARRLLSIGPDDVVMGCLPLSHAFGMTCGLAAAISTGATLALLPTFRPGQRVGNVCGRTGHRLRGATLHVRRDARGHRRPRARLRLVTGLHLGGRDDACGDAAPVRGQSDCAVLEGYGLSETSGPACFNRPAARARSVQSAHPSTAYRCEWSTNTLPRCRPGHPARYKSAGPT